MRVPRFFTEFRVGAIFIVVAVVVLYLGFTKAIPFRSHYEIKAVFETSNNIRPASPVRIAGVNVGKVVAVDHSAKGSETATVTMRIDKAGRPIHVDARAKVRPRIFLGGNYFVDLAPGTPSAKEIANGGTIPLDRTSTPVALDDIFQIFRADTRRDLRTALRELANTFDHGGAQAFSRSFRYQPDAYKYTAVVNQALLGQRPHDLSDFIRDFGTVAAALDSDPAALKSLITDFNTTLAALAREDGNLEATVAELPRTLRIAGPAFDALNRAFPPTRRFARAALPAVRSSGPTIDALVPLVTQLRGFVSADELRGLSSDLRATTPSLTQLAIQTTPLMEQVRAASSCQNEVILPWSHDKLVDDAFPSTGPVYEESVKFLPAIGGESRSADANGPWFKVLGTGGVETFQLGSGNFGTSLFPFLGSNPPKPAGRSPLRPDVPCETQQQPDLRTNPGNPPARVKADNTPAAQAITAKLKARAIKQLRADLRRSGSKLKVSDQDVTRAVVEEIARRNGKLGQLKRLGLGG